ncbi:2-succinyl-5-enolpyruvyl-6-hydroxy-3-cyclohexene-1-carboxylic-acid synthase [Alicyclobacillus dauci]|uniref:2-succinyl-5-enolpyruvyl-6-hydroxy-3-cyclohexene-1-carboxylate synthase n=1 Tax=Alicyclobacillus dauci TaxID=1475485 RepID=A0ABY6Z7J4_9BACL|nr:2-succinyl-5-enolpyruvyl-6-hydroxy-3-cyclohexene-1-carboxylic-acid synthase [Alicyclobacillus dauci]WAH38792.1 2-succinyl-5-enolpyruvyl-6-hydroxy-3-cyclohexene-1-carboxylic-acid synthase [Alicyclobacillus dauci]
MANDNLWPVHSFVDGLANAGVKHAVVSPGSRNTPLTLALVEHPDIEVYTHLDERSAAFFALGIARSTGAPVVISCTSGTAMANYYPAVMEAYEARVPLIVVTADRPQRLREVGANQTVRQYGLYDGHVKTSIEMPVPDGSMVVARYAAAVAARAVATSLTSPRGPVHVNFPFEEPLMLPRRDTLTRDQHVQTPTVYARKAAPVAEEAVQFLTNALAGATRPLIVVGPLDDPQLVETVVQFAEANHIAVLADVLSQARGRLAGGTAVIDYYDLLLAAAGSTIPVPDVVLRFGAQPTSKSLATFMNRWTDESTVFLVDDTEWYRDASFHATHVLVGDLKPTLADMALPQSESRESYLRLWQHANEQVANSVAHFTSLTWFEGTAIRALTRAVGSRAQLVFGNSRPIRDADALADMTGQGVRTYANRGVSGIDGVVSTAFGISAGNRDLPTVLCIGDVSFYHDLNGLLAARRFHVPLTVLLIHNEGGGIFQHLSQAERKDTLEYFTTPHGLEFEDIVHAYGGVYRRVDDEESMIAAVQESMKNEGLNVVEVRFRNDASAAHYRSLKALVMDALQVKTQ